MRVRGEGTIQKLPNGRYRGVIQIDRKRIYGPTVPKRAEALPALWKKLDKLYTADEEPEQTLSSLLASKLYSIRLSGDYSPTTVNLWEAFEKRLNASPIAQNLPSEIDAHSIDQFRASLPGKGRTVDNYTRHLLQLLRESGREIKYKVAQTRQTPNARVLSPDEERMLLSMEMTDETRLMIELALHMGLRRSEIAGLHHEDVDGGGVVIRRAVVRVKGTIAIKGTKTESSEAWIPLPESLVGTIGNGKGFVIGGRDLPVSPSVLDDRFRRLIAREPRLKGVGLHDLRRTFGMRLLESGVDIRTAAELMRHDPTMLMKLYAKSRRDLKIIAMKQVSLPPSVRQAINEAS